MTAYKLLITATVKSTTFERFLGSNEVVRGDPFLLTVEVENIGEAEFPGGKIGLFRIAHGSPVHSYSTFGLKNECPPLAVGQSTKLIDGQETIPFVSGLAWVQIALTPIGDAQAIEYYQTRDEPLPLRDIWRSPIYVIERESLRIIDLLKKLLEKGAS